MRAYVTNPEMHASLNKISFTSQAASDIMEDQGIDNLQELKVVDDK